jgi:hypothetical protein
VTLCPNAFPSRSESLEVTRSLRAHRLADCAPSRSCTTHAHAKPTPCQWPRIQLSGGGWTAGKNFHRAMAARCPSGISLDAAVSAAYRSCVSVRHPNKRGRGGGRRSRTEQTRARRVDTVARRIVRLGIECDTDIVFPVLPVEEKILVRVRVGVLQAEHGSTSR